MRTRVAGVALATLALAGCSVRSWPTCPPPPVDHTTLGCETEDEIVLRVMGNPYIYHDGDYVCVHIDYLRPTLDK